MTKENGVTGTEQGKALLEAVNAYNASVRHYEDSEHAYEVARSQVAATNETLNEARDAKVMARRTVDSIIERMGHEGIDGSPASE